MYQNIISSFPINTILVFDKSTGLHISCLRFIEYLLWASSCAIAYCILSQVIHTATP